MSYSLSVSPGGALIVHDVPPPPALPFLVVLVFDQGDYRHALRCYEAAKTWAVETGAAYRDGLAGTIHRPHHPESPASDPIVPNHLLGSPLWSLTVDNECDADTLEWLRGVPVPDGARLVFPDTDPETDGGDAS